MPGPPRPRPFGVEGRERRVLGAVVCCVEQLLTEPQHKPPPSPRAPILQPSTHRVRCGVITTNLTSPVGFVFRRKRRPLPLFFHFSPACLLAYKAVPEWVASAHGVAKSKAKSWGIQGDPLETLSTRPPGPLLPLVISVVPCALLLQLTPGLWHVVLILVPIRKTPSPFLPHVRPLTALTNLSQHHHSAVQLHAEYSLTTLKLSSS